MNTELYTWSHLLFTADILVQKGCLDENQLKSIIHLVDIKKIVKNNKLSEKFIQEEIVPRIDYDDYDGLDLYQIESYQSHFN
jgi:hypothetical protein